ncbi:TVAZ2 protein, partial [Polypterus senegalus]
MDKAVCMEELNLVNPSSDAEENTRSDIPMSSHTVSSDPRSHNVHDLCVGAATAFPPTGSVGAHSKLAVSSQGHRKTRILAHLSDYDVEYCPSGGLITSDSVTSNEKNVVGTEGRTVTLQCSYSTSNSYTYLFWYRKYPSEAMQYILFKGARSVNTVKDTAAFAQERFSSTTGQEFTVLTISSLSLSDSAIYYCALQSTMFHSAEALSKNCITTDGRDSNFKQSNVAN